MTVAPRVGVVTTSPTETTNRAMGDVETSPTESTAGPVEGVLAPSTPPALARPNPTARLTFDAIGEAAATAESYARAASQFAAIGDARGLGYAIRCAAAALSCASTAALALRPAETGGGR